MREKTIEQKLFHAVREEGGLALKLSGNAMAGMPDRLLLLPGGRIAFAEVKAPGKKPRVLQLLRMDFLRRLGFTVFVLDDPAKIPVLLKMMKAQGRKEGSA